MDFKDDRIGPGVPEFREHLKEPELKNITVLVSEWIDLCIKLMAAEEQIQSLRSQLSASLKLQMDLAEENVRLREALVEIAPIAETLNKNISVWEFLPTFYRALSLNLLASIKAIAAKALEGK